MTDRYSNEVYETETYKFESNIDTLKKIRILVKANVPNDEINMPKLEQLMTERINDINKIEDSDITVINYDKKVKHIKDFLCLGTITFIKPLKSYMTGIVCNHASDNDLTEIDFVIQNCKDLDSAYTIAENFITGFNYYTKKQVEYEDSLIKSKYTISTTIQPYKDTSEYITGRKISRLVDVTINEQLTNPFVEILFDEGFGTFVIPNENNNRELTLKCFDKEKGIIHKKGEVVFLNSFGKRIKIPFSFTYDNE
jgi:hypothetical protein